MSYIDLHTTLRDWPFDPERISVRKIRGGDGIARIQMRVELGVLQMETEGRPDGARPFGYESRLAYHQRRLAQFESHNGTTLGFTLSPRHCEELRIESSLYYRRFVASFVLEDYASVANDTSHNLAVFDLCRDHALESNDRQALEPFRPYVLMMDARARAHQAMQESDSASALAHVNRGIMHIRSFFEERGDLEGLERCEDIKILHALASEVVAKVPRNSPIGVRKALRAAIAEERFEDAAKLRDAMKHAYAQENEAE